MNFSRYSVDVRQVMEDLYIGPKAEVIELLDNFNNNYTNGQDDLRIGITPKFRWRPGSYDKVKTICEQQWLEWHKRPAGMASIFDRRRTYRRNSLREALLTIDNTLYQFRREGRTFLNDNDEIQGKFRLFRDNCLESFTHLKNLYPKSTLTIEQEDTSFRHHILSLNVYMDDININVSVGNREETRELGSIPYGSVIISLKIPLVQLFNLMYNYLDSLTTTERCSSVCKGAINTEGTIIPKYRGTLHPYISRNNRYWGQRGNTCMGNLNDDILNTFGTLNWAILAIHLSNWMETYKINVTNPLNPLQYSILGKNESMSDEFWGIITPRDTLSCYRDQYHAFDVPDRPIKDTEKLVINQCNESKCMLRDNCDKYIKATNRPEPEVQPEMNQDQIDMLNWANELRNVNF